MRRKRLVSVCATAAVAGVFLLGGCVSAATKTSAPGSPAASKTPAAGSPAAAQTPAAGGTVHLIDYSDNDGPRSTVILTGAIGDFGKAVSIHANGTIDPQHSSELKLALTQGSFRLSIAGLDKKIVSAFRHFPSDTSTCSGTVRVTGGTPIVAGSGTGSYRGISGNFNLTVTIAEIVPKSQCNASAAFLAEALFMAGPGTVSFS